jgi:asparagine synthase (glutamine-hydrolysing)
MCGIFGQFHPVCADPALIERMARRLAHRGPDGYGVYHHERLAFGAGRLAIIDLAAPAGAIFNEDRTIGVVFNGEIYNYKTLRAELERAGHVFQTNTDTEVIVHGYEQWGIDALTRLRGMFALGIWDQARERLLLARDRMGEKPLYWTQLADRELLFASEAKALFEHSGVVRAVNQDALPAYLTLGYVPPPMTLFAGLHKLAPGEYLIAEGGAIRVSAYWTPVMDAANAPTYPDAVKLLRAKLIETVEAQMMSDVPIGAFLSGGVDSSAVVAIMARATRQPVQTFTVGYEAEAGSRYDQKFNQDVDYAAEVAAALNTDHHLITLKADDGGKLASLVTRLIYMLDEPITDATAILTAYVSALARIHQIPVLLSGEGGDELFGGYNHYQTDRLLSRYLAIPALLRSSVLTPLLERLPRDGARKLARKSRHTDPARRYLEWLRWIEPERVPSLLVDDRLTPQPPLHMESRLTPQPPLHMERGSRVQRDGGEANPFESVAQFLRPVLAAPRTSHFTDRIAFADLRLRLPEYWNCRVDKMSMTMSIEARAPLEDYQLAEFALALPLSYKLRGGQSKAVFKDAIRDLVPASVLTRKKWGFNPPTSGWMRTILRPLVEQTLTRERVEAAGVFRADAVQTLIRDHIGAGKYEMHALWTALVFHLWHAQYIDGSIAPGTITPEEVYAP